MDENSTTPVKSNRTKKNNRFFCRRPSPIRLTKLLRLRGGIGTKFKKKRKTTTTTMSANAATNDTTATSTTVNDQNNKMDIVFDEPTLGIQRNPLSLVRSASTPSPSSQKSKNLDSNSNDDIIVVVHNFDGSNNSTNSSASFSFFSHSITNDNVRDIIVNPSSLMRQEDGRDEFELKFQDAATTSCNGSGGTGSHSSASNYFLKDVNGNRQVEYYCDDWGNVSLASSLTNSAHHFNNTNNKHGSELNVDDTWSSTNSSSHSRRGSSGSGSGSGSTSSGSNNSSRFILHRRGGSGGGGGSFYHGNRRGRLDSHSTVSSSLLGIAILEEHGNIEEDGEESNTISDGSLYTMNNHSSNSSSSRSLLSSPSPVDVNGLGRNIIRIDYGIDDMGLVPPPPPAFQRRVPSSGLVPLSAPPTRRASNLQVVHRHHYRGNENSIFEDEDLGENDDEDASSSGSDNWIGPSRFEI